MKLLFLLAPIISIFYGSNSFLKVRRDTVNIKNLPEALKGFTILHLTDLHANDINKMNLNVWKNIDKLTFDAVVITGDIIIKNPKQLTPHLPYIKKLCGEKPVYFVDGNHDRFHKFTEFPALLEDLGVQVISNKKVILPVKDAGIEFVGIANTRKKRLLNLQELFGKPNPKNTVRVVLCHMPQKFDLFKSYLPDITLTGHTHAGQLRLPFAPTLYAPDQGVLPKYGYGWYNFAGAKMFVSKGIGHTFFPLRFWNRPEILLLSLQ